MTRSEVYVRIKHRLAGMKKFAIEKGDGVQADKIRKIELDLVRLINDEEARHLAREIENV